MVGQTVTVSWSMAAHGIMRPNWTAFPCEVIIVTGHFCTFRDKTQFWAVALKSPSGYAPSTELGGRGDYGMEYSKSLPRFSSLFW